MTGHIDDPPMIDPRSGVIQRRFDSVEPGIEALQAADGNGITYAR
jgi:hypothetical protein